MAGTEIAPYGSWKSPITADLITAGIAGLSEINLDGEDVYWIEIRPTEEGRNVIVKRTSDGRTTDMTPQPFNARTRVHEYGGGAYVVFNGNIYFSNFADQRLYRQTAGVKPQSFTSALNLFYADGVIDRRRNLMFCVREDHTNNGEALNTLVSLNLEGDDEGLVLVSDNDFYSSPRLSPDGTRLAWLTWNHPNMPWDGTELWVGELNANGSVGERVRVAGGSDESIFQPEWSPDGVLHFISDRTGWWNLYFWQDGRIEKLCEMSAEFGLPQWVFGLSTYTFESADRIICTFNEQGNWRLAMLDRRTQRLEPIEVPYTDIRYVRAVPGRIVFLAGSPTEPTSIIQLDLATHQREVLRRSSNVEFDVGYLSIPQRVNFPTGNGLTAHGFFYQPKNCDFVAPEGEQPPLLVMSHGGPTSATSAVLRYGIQYWTSRGIAVLDVNYSGSTGYGRAYRLRLNGQWGIVDVADCENGARYLVERGEVDGKRLAITGGSAGGYTTLCALTFGDTFKAGASYYGVSDLEVLTQDTHKFESRYLDTLIGPYPEYRNLYRERSPIYHTQHLACPMIILQGLEDKIVPPNQAEMMFKAVHSKGLPVAYLTFEGEQHGFRRAENLKRALEAELYFYSRIFGFDLADPIEPILIENL